MRPRVGRLLGLALGWTLTLAAVLVGCVLALPIIVLGWLCLVLARLFQLLTKRREVDGSADGGEPDALTPELAEQIDGRASAAAVRLLGERLDVDQQMDCGCLRLADPQAVCPKCGYTTCVGHSPLNHYCEPADAASTPLYDWSLDVDWPVANQLKPANLDNSAAVPNELLNEIYKHLEQQR